MAVLWAVWLLAFAALLVHWLRAARRRWLLALMFAGVLAAVAMPGAWRDALQGWVIEWLGTWAPPTGQRGLADYVHFSLFAGLGAALALARPDWRWGGLMLELLLLAVASEAILSLVPGREGSWGDLGLDAAGALLGVLCVRLGCYYLLRSHLANAKCKK